MSLARRSVLMMAATAGLGGCASLVPRGRPSVDLATVPKGRYSLDPDHTSILFEADHAGLSGVIGRFNRVRGHFDWDPATPTTSPLEILLDVGSVDARAPALSEVLRSPEWLDVAQWPSAAFETAGVSNIIAQTGRLAGTLTWRGHQTPLAFNVTLRGAGQNLVAGRYVLGFEATAALSRSALQIGPPNAPIGDRIGLRIVTEFARGLVVS
jgi:polyisoprenoid-binding protein YceI